MSSEFNLQTLYIWPNNYLIAIYWFIDYLSLFISVTFYPCLLKFEIKFRLNLMNAHKIYTKAYCVIYASKYWFLCSWTFQKHNYIPLSLSKQDGFIGKVFF